MDLPPGCVRRMYYVYLTLRHSLGFRSISLLFREDAGKNPGETKFLHHTRSFSAAEETGIWNGAVVG